MKRTVLITGATGLVSSALLDSLTGSDLTVRALVRDPAKASALLARGVAPVAGDLGDPDSLGRAFEGVNDLWLLNAVGPRQPENSMNAVWAARAAGVERVLRLSAIGAAHDAPTRNGRLHALSDEELMKSGMQWTILRPHFFMQNLFAVAPSVSAQGAFYWDMGEGRLALIDVRDIADFAASVLTAAPARHHEEIYTLTGPESLSLADVAAKLGEGIGKSVRYVAVPHDAARHAMLENGMDPWLVGMMTEYARAYSKNWGDFTTPHIQEVLGRPARGVLDFARDHAAMFKGA